MKNLSLNGVLVVGIVIVGILALYLFFMGKESVQPSVSEPPLTSMSPPSTTFDTTYKTNLFELQYPKGWNTEEFRFQNGVITYIKPGEKGVYIPGLSIEVSYISKNKFSLSQKETVYVKSFGFKKETQTIGGIPADVLSGTALSKKEKDTVVQAAVQEVHAYIQKDGILYSITYSYDGSSKNKDYEAVFQKMLQTFRFLP